MPKPNDAPSPWPELLSLQKAADMLSMAKGTWIFLWPTLAAFYKLKTFGICGPKFDRQNVLDVMRDLRERGLNIKVDKKRNMVQVGDQEYPGGGARAVRASA